MKILKFDIGYLFACIPFFTVESEHQALEGVLIGDGWLGASCGSSMVIVNKDTFNGCDYLLSGDDVRSLYKHVLSLSLLDGFYLENFELRIVSNAEAIAVINDGVYEHSIRLTGYKRIDLKKVDIAEPKAVKLKAMEMPHFNPVLLSLFVKSNEMFEGRPVSSIKILPTGNKTAIYVEMNAYMHGVVMPILSKANCS